jgi:hypothetical protein
MTPVGGLYMDAGTGMKKKLYRQPLAAGDVSGCGLPWLALRKLQPFVHHRTLLPRPSDPPPQKKEKE